MQQCAHGGEEICVHAGAHEKIRKSPGRRRMMQLRPFRHGRQTKPFCISKVRASWYAVISCSCIQGILLKH